MRKLFIVAMLLSAAFICKSQELNSRVTVVTTRVANNVNRSTFNTLQTAIMNFLNNRKWTNETYSSNERIDCNFLLNLESTAEPNIYNASLTIQAARPVYNTSYLSPLMNFQDENITFKYVEFQQLEFNENRVSGSDALISNLTAVLAYYAYMIIAFDHDAFALKGGEPYFQRVQNIVNNAPEGRNISGWRAFDGIRNRYWLVENMLNARYEVIHDIYYGYYRRGMDLLIEDEKKSREEFMKVLEQLNSFNTENPNTMIAQFFFQGKSTEWIKIFSKAMPPEKAKARELLSKLDLTNASKYRESLK